MWATNGADIGSRVVGPTLANAQARTYCFYVGGVASGVGTRPTLADVPGAVRVSLGSLLAASSSAVCFQRSSPTSSDLDEVLVACCRLLLACRGARLLTVMRFLVI